MACKLLIVGYGPLLGLLQLSSLIRRGLKFFPGHSVKGARNGGIDILNRAG